jgi:hypothetical protein
MSNERTDEFLSWRGRLDQPGALPEQGLDNHEASWQRLAERLHEKRRRRGIGYWVAAACLLLALIPAVRFLHPRTPATVLRSPARQRTAVQKVATGSLPVEHAVSVTAPPTVGHHRSALARPDPGLIIGPTAHPAIDSIIGPTVPPATDSHQLMALLPASRVLSPKKQLKVVYYNEISNPSGPSPSTAARIPAFLKFSLGRSGSPESGGEPTEQFNNDPVLTIKLIPQNH